MGPKHGYLIKNKYKTAENPSAPDYWGKVELGGSVYSVSAWICESARTGETYLSLSAQLFKRQSVQEKIDQAKTNTETP